MGEYTEKEASHCPAKSILCIEEDQAFSPSYDLAPPPPPPLLSPVCLSSCVSPVELTDAREGRKGRETNNTTTRKPGPL
jgi:hypothetical protein